MRFTPTEDFWSDELKSQYVKGLTYTVRDPRSVLAAQAKRWISEGKAKEVVGKPRATVSGVEKRKSFLERLFSWL